MLRGIALSEGLVVGKIKKKKTPNLVILRREVTNVEGEIRRFLEAVENYQKSLKNFFAGKGYFGKENEPKNYREQVDLLTHSAMVARVIQQIKERQINAEYILQEISDNYHQLFDKVGDHHFYRNVSNVKSAVDGLVRELCRTTTFETLPEAYILAVDCLTLADLVQLEQDKVLGIISQSEPDEGEEAFIASKWQIPCVVRVNGLLSSVEDDLTVVLDGSKGEIVLQPSPEVIEYYQVKMAVNENWLLKSFRQGGPEVSAYPEEMAEQNRLTGPQVGATIKHPQEIEFLTAHGADFVGIYETDYLFNGKDRLPTVEEQFLEYRDVLMMSQGRMVIFQTFNGQAKTLKYLLHQRLDNHNDDYCSTRISLNHEKMLRDQLKALLRVSVYGPIKIVFPMITSLEEIQQIRGLLIEVGKELNAEGGFFERQVDIGLVVSAPAVAMRIDIFKEYISFIYIDYQRLTQAMLLAGGGCQPAFDYYDIYHPTVLQLVSQLVTDAHFFDIEVGLYGPFLHNERLVPLFVAMRCDFYSMSIKQIPRFSYEIGAISQEEWFIILEKCLTRSTGNQVRECLDKEWAKRFVKGRR